MLISRRGAECSDPVGVTDRFHCGSRWFVTKPMASVFLCATGLIRGGLIRECLIREASVLAGEVALSGIHDRGLRVAGEEANAGRASRTPTRWNFGSRLFARSARDRAVDAPFRVLWYCCCHAVDQLVSLRCSVRAS